MAEYEMDEWLNGGKKFEKKQFLEKWQNRPGKKVNLFLHCKAKPVEFYRHGFFRIVEDFNKETKVKSLKIRFAMLNCHEDIITSRRQNKREEDGSRKFPPQACPMCLLSEHLRAEVSAGRISWTDAVFEIEAGGEVKSVTAGAFYNAFGGDKLTPEQKAELRTAGMTPNEAWKENHTSKGAICLRVVDADATDLGTQIAIETPLVGDVIKNVIRDTKESIGESDGNPLLNPYCIQLVYNDKEPVFSKKYRAIRMEKVKPSPEILGLIQDTDPPDLGNLADPFDALALRTLLEKSALIKLPFDELFKNAKKAEAKPEKPAEEKKAAAPAKPPAPPADRQLGEVHDPNHPSREAPGDECDCDDCGAVMKLTDPKCLKCGKVYAEEAPPPPPPQRRSRSAANKPATKQEPTADGGETGDGIPF
jgi:hypothetical protein